MGICATALWILQSKLAYTVKPEGFTYKGCDVSR